MKKQWHHIIQFACLFMVLLAIMLQGFTKTVKMKPLNGYTSETEKVDFCFKTYYDGSYQEYLTQQARENTGFREFFIRNYNQVCYSCFNRVTNKNIVKGYNNELFLKPYIDEITGKQLKNYYDDVEAAKAAAKTNVDATLRLIDTLHKYNKELLFIFAPSKAAVYPEKMPKEYQRQISDFSLEEYYIGLFKENGIPHIDFYNYFKAIKDTVPYPLYTRYASHWAEWTIPMVADSILRKMETLGRYKLPTIQCINPNVSSIYCYLDHELESTSNLLFPCPKPAIPNPIVALNDTLGSNPPKLFVVGDSYFNQLQQSPFINAFHQWDFWRYGIIACSSKGYEQVPVEELIDSRMPLVEADIVMIVQTAPLIYDYMYGLHYLAYDMLQNNPRYQEERIQKMIKSIQSNAEWYDAVVRQAEERGLTVEENLRRNAVYVLENNNKHN